MEFRYDILYIYTFSGNRHGTINIYIYSGVFNISHRNTVSKFPYNVEIFHFFFPIHDTA